MEGDLEQPVCRLVQVVGIQHSDFTGITQPYQGRKLPEAFPYLGHTHAHTYSTNTHVTQGRKTQKDWQGEYNGKGEKHI